MEKILLSVLPYCDSKLARAMKHAHGSIEVWRSSRAAALRTLNHLIATRQIERGEIMVGTRSNVGNPHPFKTNEAIKITESIVDELIAEDL